MASATRRRWPMFLGVLGICLLASAGLLAINWGEPDGNGHPNVGTVVIQQAGGLTHMCSGTLIAPHAFLTAGHCGAWWKALIASDEFTIDDMFVSFDPENPLTAPAGWHAVTDIKVHPLYGLSPRKDSRFDVAVLVLRDAETLIEPATLPEAGYLDGLLASGAFKGGVKRARFTVVGYGSQLTWPPPQLVYGHDRRVATSGYMALTGGWLLLSQNHAAGNGGTGYGDSGGPAFWHDEELGDILVGTTVWGDMMTVATGIDQRLDLPQILEFLQQFME